MTSIEERLVLEGKTFRVDFEHDGTAGYVNRTAFNLNTVNWDYNADGVLETTPFKEEEFIITGIKIVVGSGDTLGGIIIDGKSITQYENLATGSYFIDGRSILPNDGNYPALHRLLGGNDWANMGYVMRDKMEIWNSAGTNICYVYLVGIRIPRKV